MKTRIISGIVMGAIVALALALGIFVSDWFVTGFMAIIAAIGSYELLGNAAGIKSKAAIIGAFIYTAAAVAIKGGNVAVLDGNLPLFLGIAFFLYAVIIILKNHKDFGLAQIVTFCAMPIILAFAFSFLGFIISISTVTQIADSGTEAIMQRPYTVLKEVSCASDIDSISI